MISNGWSKEKLKRELLITDFHIFKVKSSVDPFHNNMNIVNTFKL